MKMIEYQKVFKSLKLPDLIGEIAIGEVPLPLAEIDAPPYWYGFPPALIPVWSESGRPKYFGYWKHWFVDREPTFVQMYVASGRMTFEIARTADQFYRYIALSSLVEHDGVTPELEDFIRRAGIRNLSQLDAVSLATGDDPHGFVKVDQFYEKTPLSSVLENSSYDGGFPVILENNQDMSLGAVCEFEVDVAVLKDWPRNIRRPTWFSGAESSRLDLFRLFLAEGKFDLAWLTLNSRGWSIREARLALVGLSVAAKSSDFDILVSAWLSIADEGIGGY